MEVLDTDVLIDLIRKHPPAVAWASGLRGVGVIVPGFVELELIEGCRSRRDLNAIEAILRPFKTVWPSVAACDAAAGFLRQFRLSHGLGMNDALIAATAKMLGRPLNTFNVKHFGVIPGLLTVQPYTR